MLDAYDFAMRILNSATRDDTTDFDHVYAAMKRKQEREEWKNNTTRRSHRQR